MDIGVHALDLTLHILGFPQPLAVSAITGAYFGPQREGLGWWGSDIVGEGPARCDVEDNAVAFIRLADGAALTLEVSWASYARPEERYQFLGTAGGADIAPEMYGRERRLHVYRQEHGQAVDITPELPQYSNTGQDRLIADFLQRLERGEPPLITPRQQLTVVRILNGILESAAAGHEVRL
jgi:predicted dehydrogenase